MYLDSEIALGMQINAADICQNTSICILPSPLDGGTLHTIYTAASEVITLKFNIGAK